LSWGGGQELTLTRNGQSTKVDKGSVIYDGCVGLVLFCAFDFIRRSTQDASDRRPYIRHMTNTILLLDNYNYDIIIRCFVPLHWLSQLLASMCVVAKILRTVSLALR